MSTNTRTRNSSKKVVIRNAADGVQFIQSLYEDVDRQISADDAYNMFVIMQGVVDEWTSRDRVVHRNGVMETCERWLYAHLASRGTVNVTPLPTDDMLRAIRVGNPERGIVGYSDPLRDFEVAWCERHDLKVPRVRAGYLRLLKIHRDQYGKGLESTCEVCKNFWATKNAERAEVSARMNQLAEQGRNLVSFTE